MGFNLSPSFKKLTMFTFIFCFLFQLSLSIILKIDPTKTNKGIDNPYCFVQQFFKGEIITLSFVITGANKLDKVNATLYDPDRVVVYEVKDGKYGDFNDFEINNGGRYTLCFRPLSNAKMSLNFVLYSKDENLGHRKEDELAKDSSLRELSKYTSRIDEVIEMIRTKVGFIIDRRLKHANIINRQEATFRSVIFWKTIAIIAISLIQVYLIRTFYIRRENKWNI